MLGCNNTMKIYLVSWDSLCDGTGKELLRCVIWSVVNHSLLESPKTHLVNNLCKGYCPFVIFEGFTPVE
jgi:hypothetical protein